MIPSFYPTETWVMRIFPYLVNLDTTTNERIKFIFPILLSMESYKQQFFTNAIVRILRINKTKNFILELCGKLILTMQKHMKNLLLSIPKQYYITPK